MTDPVGPRRARALLNHVIGLADEPADDDLRLRKRVLVIASDILIVGALQLPALAEGHPVEGCANERGGSSLEEAGVEVAGVVDEDIDASEALVIGVLPNASLSAHEGRRVGVT